jgi:phosphoglycerate dehydrogenase-like enzyme
MKILLQYPFEAEQVKAFRDLAQRMGGHELIVAENDDEALKAAPDVEVILGWFKPAVCAAAEDLKWIQSFSTGMEKFLFPEIIERDEVRISNVAGLYASQGAEHAWALLLALTRQLPFALQNMGRKEWKGRGVIEIAGMTLGLVGFGGFGVEMAKRAQGYNMRILAIDPVRTDKPDYISELKKNSKENLHSLLRRSDIVMTACPLTAETYHLIGEEELNLMKNSAYLINVTRGGIVDEPALVAALKAGKIAGCGLDVTEKEPLASESPLWEAPNLIITPHVAGASQHRPRMIFEFFMANLERYLKDDKPLAVIDKQKGY